MALPASKPDRLTRDQLLAAYTSYARPRSEWLVGGEFERHLLRPDGSPVPYGGEHGIRWLLGRIAERGWSAKYEGELPIALHRDGAWITLEPGGQLELSGSPSEHVADVVSEARTFCVEVQDAIGDAPIVQVPLGYTPFASLDSVDWMPKGRYVVMRTYLGKTGDLAHAMMKGTASVQASFDFGSEEDCGRKMRLGAQIGPLITAMFANSPLTAGLPNGFMSYRGHIWTRVDPDRTGFPPAALDFSYERWVDYLMDVPMMFTRIDGNWADAGGRTFRAWMDEGLDGVFPTWDDWELHLTSVFPEIRVKRQIEVRGADCVPLDLAASFVALFKGLFYCNRATRDVIELAERFDAAGTRAERFYAACRHGLAGEVGGRRLSAWAEELMELGLGGISRCDPEDLPLLDPLVRQVQSGESPAAHVLRLREAHPDPAEFLAAYRA